MFDFIVLNPLASVSPQAIRGYSGQEFTDLNWNSGTLEL